MLFDILRCVWRFLRELQVILVAEIEKVEPVPAYEPKLFANGMIASACSFILTGPANELMRWDVR